MRHALGNGLRLDGRVFDEAYGQDPVGLFGLDALGQTSIGEALKHFRCWPTLPPSHSQRREFASKKVQDIVRWSPAFIDPSWQSFPIARETAQRVTWNVKAALVPRVHDGVPTDRTDGPIVAWNRATDEDQYFLSNAPPHTALDLPLRGALRRLKIEHFFRRAQGEVGRSHCEGRSYVGRMRPMILGQTVLLFAAGFGKSGRIDPLRPAGPEELGPAVEPSCLPPWSRSPTR